MNKLLKIFCFYGLFCLCYCCKNSINPNLINKKVCKQILVKNYFDDNEYTINDDISIQELYELLQNATLCDIIKLPPRLVLTIKGTNYHQTFFICDNYIKDDKRKIYKCKKNIEKELKKIIKEKYGEAAGVRRIPSRTPYRRHRCLRYALYRLREVSTARFVPNLRGRGEIMQ